MNACRLAALAAAFSAADSLRVTSAVIPSLSCPTLEPMILKRLSPFLVIDTIFDQRRPETAARTPLTRTFDPLGLTVPCSLT